MATLPLAQSARTSMPSAGFVNARAHPLSQSITAANAAVSSGEPQSLNPCEPRVPRPPANTVA